MKLLKLKFVPNRRIFYMSYDKLEVRFSLLTSVVVLIQAKVPPPPLEKNNNNKASSLDELINMFVA